MMKRLSIVGFTLVMLVLIAAACGPSGVEPVAELGQPTPEVTVNNSNPNAEEIQTIQLDNCDGKGDSKRTEVRSQSIEAEISAGLAAQIGSNVGVVQGAVQVAVGTALTSGSERSSSIELSAPPGTHMEIQLVWTGEEQVGVVENILDSDVPIAFRSFSPIDVRIKSQYDLGCPSSPSGNGQGSTLPEAQSQEAVPSEGSVGQQDSANGASDPSPIEAPIIVTQPTVSVAVGNLERFEVQANVWKNGTRIVVAPGDTVHVQYLEGQWTGDSSQPGSTEGCGYRFDDPVAEHVWIFPPEQRGAALVGYIDSSPFFIGCHPLDYVAPVGGELFLGMSECDGCYWDNAGQLYVKIEVTRP